MIATSVNEMYRTVQDSVWIEVCLELFKSPCCLLDLSTHPVLGLSSSAHLYECQLPGPPSATATLYDYSSFNYFG